MKDKSCLTLFLGLFLAACSTIPPNGDVVSASDEGIEALLDYRQSLSAMSANELARERGELVARSTEPARQMRLALLLTQPRPASVADLPRAAALLEAILKSTDNSARALQPLARLLFDQVGERLRLENQLERQAGQLRESQKRAVELQEKIDRLAEIERSLPQRPPVLPPAGGAR